MSPSNTRGTLSLTGTLFALLCACPAGPSRGPRRRAAAPPAPPVTPGSVKVFTAGQGIRVAMAQMKGGPWLVRISGTTSAVDGKVMPARLERNGVAYRHWITRYDGRDYRLVTLRLRRQGNPYYLLSVPGEGYMQSIRMRYDPKRSEKLDPRVLWRAHQRQKADGSLAALQRFHLRAHQRREQRYVESATRRMNKKCGTRIESQIVWDSIPRKTPDAVRVRHACKSGVYALDQLCRWESAREVFRRHVKRYRCHLGDELRVRLEGDTLHLTTPHQVRNRDPKVRRLVATGIRWGGGPTLAERIHWERTRICTDGKGGYVGLQPRRSPEKWGDVKRRVFYGTAKGLTWVPRPRHYRDGQFYDPRHLVRRRYGKGWNSRYRSRFVYDADKGQCAVWCGKRRIPLRPVPSAQTRTLLAKHRIKPPLPRRQPYGLARDRRGIYYYVDRAAGKGARDFRLYRGPLGKLKRLKMVNIVSDTEGDVFSTQNGSLRLVLEKEHSYWVRRGRKRRLINVPIEKNLPMIFNELGVYLGKPYGTPCDLF